MYHDYHLKFTTESAADAVLFEGDDRRPRYAAIDVIGVIYKPTGKMLTTDDGDAPEMAPVPGWHVNVRHTAEAPELNAYSVAPSSPERVWF
jgi:hypothetical protein